MLTLFGMSSPNVLKISIMLEETGLTYDMRYVNVFAGDQFKEAFLKISPNNKVPALIDEAGPDGKPLALCESGAILLYLAEKTGQFLPPSGAARAIALQWFAIQLGSVGPMFGQYVHFTRYAPPGNDYSGERYTSELRRILNVLETRLDLVPYLGGDAYTIADIATYPWIRTAASMFECLRPAAGEHALGRYPALKRWFELVSARPGVIAGLESGERFMPQDGKAVASSNAAAIDRFLGRGQFAHQ